jgi:hypothetical protein
MFRLNGKLEDKRITDIEALRAGFPGTASSSVADKEDLKCRRPISGSTSYGPGTPDDGIGNTAYNRVPLTRESLDLMDAPIPSGVLAEEFAYHGLARSFLKEMQEARQLLDKICLEVKWYKVTKSCLL